MIRYGLWIIILPLLFGLVACSKKQSDRTKQTQQTEKSEEQADSLVEQINIHPADSSVMEKRTREAVPDSLPIIVIKKGSCYGNCPVYEARLFRNGRAVFEGKEYVELVGTYTAQMDSIQINDIYEKVAFIDYFSMSDKYPDKGPPISDLPNTTTTVRKDGREKTIVNNSGAPRELTDFEDYLERTFLELEWESQSPEDKD